MAAKRAPTEKKCRLPYGRRSRFYIGPSGASALGGQSDGRHPAKPARSCGSMPHRGIDRCATPQRRPLRVILMLVAKVATPQSPSVTAPLGGEPLRADDEHRPLQKRRRGFRPRRGQYGEGPKSVKKNAVIPAFFSFWVLRPQLWGSKGRVAPWAGFAASQQRDFFRYLFWSQKR